MPVAIEARLSDLIMSSDTKANRSCQVDFKASFNNQSSCCGGRSLDFGLTDLGSDRPRLKSQVCYLLVSLSLFICRNGMLTPTNPHWVGLMIQ